MNKNTLMVAALFFCGAAQAQLPEDALKMTWQPVSGTARYQAIGGAIGSLGGDITSMFVNPAGLGFYKNSEAVFTPGFLAAGKTNGQYLGSAYSQPGDGNFSLGTTGFVFGGGRTKYKNTNKAFGLAINRVADFNTNVKYSGTNTVSSLSEQFAEEWSGSGLTRDQLLSTSSAAPYTLSPAYYTYLIDLDTVNNKIFTPTDKILNAGGSVLQNYNRKTSGGITELAFAAAGNTADKWYYGGTLGLDIVNFSNDLYYSESDATGNTNNGFSSFNYEDHYTTKGFGGNIKVGVVYRPQEKLRLGLALHSPMLLMLTDEHWSSITTNLENPVQTLTANSSLFMNGNEKGSSDYRQHTGFKGILSVSYVINEVADVTKQRGFVSADMEFVGNNGSGFSGSNAADYYKQLGTTIKDIYKTSMNAHVGGELKFSTFMVRAGAAYYGNPYKSGSLKANQLNLGGGVGYRNNGFFADVAYVYKTVKDAQYPYLLSGQPNQAADLKSTRGLAVFTVGIKF